MKIRALVSPVALACTLAVAGLGMGAAYYVSGPPRAVEPGGASASLSPDHGANDDMVTRLKDYTRSIGGGAAAPAPEKLLPDVNTMIDRLAARLEAAPGDAKGWRMLGWSYFHTARYQEAAAAYARAVDLDPGSAELRATYEEAKAKASGGDTSEAGSRAQAEANGKTAVGARIAGGGSIAAMTEQERVAAIRSMVDGLAERLANAPRDVDGWTRLMRSRVVLGEREAAASELRKALDVFKDDPNASDRITAAASQLGLKVE